MIDDSWDVQNTISTPLTEEALKEAFKLIEQTEYKICRHVVHPKEVGKGWTTCGACLSPVYV